MRIYLAAPLFNQAERAFNSQLTEELEERGFTVFLPQRDGVEPSKSPYNEMTSDELCQAIFEADQDKIHEADVFLFVLDGRIPDEGACVALGIAYGQKQLPERDKLLVGLLTDLRGAYPFLGAKLNPMIYGSLDFVAVDKSELIVSLEDYRNTKTDRV
jgi:hypothetical protein